VVELVKHHRASMAQNRVSTVRRLPSVPGIWIRLELNVLNVKTFYVVLVFIFILLSLSLKFFLPVLVLFWWSTYLVYLHCKSFVNWYILNCFWFHYPWFQF
jgi:hypothetical protein